MMHDAQFFDDIDILMHFGVGWDDGAPGRGSGRYEHGTGDKPNQHAGGFLQRYNEYKNQGLTERQIADAMGTTTTGLRAQLTMAKHIAKEERRSRCQALKDKGYSFKAIENETGISASTVQSLLNEASKERQQKALKTAEFLKERISEKGIIDVGDGVERELRVSKEKLNEALEILKQEGYVVRNAKIAQVTNPGQLTNFKVVGPPGTATKGPIDYEKVTSLNDYISYDEGETFKPSFAYPASLDSSRLKIRYSGDEGGELKDGLIEIRRGVEDLSLGKSNYAQVRILVDGTHYLKGMAVYSDGKDMPDGVDVIFNTNKAPGTPALGEGKNSVLKPISKDPDNPFGSLIKEHGGQYYYPDKDGNEKLGLINKRADEGDWDEWSKTLPSQFLSKQSKKLITNQLALAEGEMRDEYESICALTNPTVKRKLLQEFSDDCDTAAVTLKAAALPRQRYQVIMPLTSISDKEVYAPNYNNGETVALIRYPHGGTFEIPILKVNNKNKEGLDALGKNPLDAIGINAKVASQLSGADFDGDTVMVIPCNSSTSSVHITATHPLKGLEGFDPKVEYGYREGMKVMTKAQTQIQMGIVSNLITDMTIRGAKEDELARAVRHSMVVIDAEKHKLDWQRSEKENDIDSLKQRYQPHQDDDGYGGASTLISRAKSPKRVTKRQGSPHINPDGSISYTEADDAYYEKSKKVYKKDPVTGKRIKDADGNYVYEYVKSGKIAVRTQESTQMREAKDARELSSGYEQEELYANYANARKAMANTARKEMMATGRLKLDPEAKAKYKDAVDSLDKKLDVAKKNSPKEREAQRLATIDVKYKEDADPDLTKKEKKKLRQQAITKYRDLLGAKRDPIDITDYEWEAIQKGAISDNKLTEILKYANSDKVRQLATPKDRDIVSTVQANRMQRLLDRGFTTAEIADAVGVSTSVVIDTIKKERGED